MRRRGQIRTRAGSPAGMGDLPPIRPTHPRNQTQKTIQREIQLPGEPRELSDTERAEAEIEAKMAKVD